MTDTARTSDVTDGPIHTWFSLSYTNYQVLPRTLMQSMPTEWQERMVACLNELQDAFSHIPQAEVYEVKAATEHIVRDMSSEELDEASITKNWEVDGTSPMSPWDDDFKEWQDQHLVDEPSFRNAALELLNPDERVLLPTTDPVPHYNRGRTYIAPQVHACDNCDGIDPSTCLTAPKGN